MVLEVDLPSDAVDRCLHKLKRSVTKPKKERERKGERQGETYFGSEVTE